DDRGVVDEDVEPAVASCCEIHGVLPVGLARDVQVRVRGLAAGSADRGFDLLALGVEDVTEDDLRALARDPLGPGRALTPRPPADQRDLPIELSHLSLPVC